MHSLEPEAYERFAAKYAEGNMPWDTGIVPPEVRALVEGESPLPPGRALDIGCGTGTSSLYLAAHGWQVTGVDWIEAALAQARQKAQSAGFSDANMRFLRADATAPDFLAEHPPVALWLDIGCLHSLGPEGRTRYANHAARLVLPGGTLLLYGWQEREHNGHILRLDASTVTGLFAPAFTLFHWVGGVEIHCPDRASGWFTLRRAVE